MSVSTGCVCQLWTEALDMMMPYRIIADNPLLCHHCDYPAGGETIESTYMCDSWEDHDKWLYFYEEPLKPSKILCQQGTLLAQLDVWLLVFFDCKCLRLWSFSKERGGHPRWSSTGVAARRGNPGQESRNQGGRVHERVSGETLFST